MALTRKYLSALGITGDAQDEVINAYVEQMDEIKAERDAYKADAEKLVTVQKQLDEANSKLAKQGEGETILKADYDKLQKEYDEYKGTIEAKQLQETKQTAVRKLLKDIGVAEKRIDSVLKVTDLDEFELDENGLLKDAEKHTEYFKTEFDDFIETSNTDGAGTPTPPQTTNSSKDPFEIGFDEG